MPRDKLISYIEWAVIIGTGALDVILARVTGIPLSVPGNVIACIGIIFGLWPLTALLTRATGFAKGSEVLAENAAKFFIFVIAVSGLEYYCATNSAPFNDDLMVKIDAFFGFDWPSFFDWVSAHKPLGKIMALLYVSLSFQAVVVLFAVGVVYPRRANRFVTAFLVSGLLTLALFWALPVGGAFVHFHHTDLPQAFYAAHYMALHDHTMKAISLNDIRGIISFPSFHVSSAVIITYFFRRIRFLFPLAVLLNTGMSVSALYMGGHYLTDVIAGIAVALVTIVFLHWLQGSEPEQRLPLGLRRKSA